MALNWLVCIGCMVVLSTTLVAADDEPSLTPYVPTEDGTVEPSPDRGFSEDVVFPETSSEAVPKIDYDNVKFDYVDHSTGMSDRQRKLLVKHRNWIKQQNDKGNV